MTQIPPGSCKNYCQCKPAFPGGKCSLHPDSNSPHSPVGRRKRFTDLHQLKRTNLLESIRARQEENKLDDLLKEELEVVGQSVMNDPEQQQLEDYLEYEQRFESVEMMED